MGNVLLLCRSTVLSPFLSSFQDPVADMSNEANVKEKQKAKKVGNKRICQDVLDENEDENEEDFDDMSDLIGSSGQEDSDSDEEHEEEEIVTVPIKPVKKPSGKKR